MGIRPSWRVSQGGLENPVWRQPLTLPSPEYKTDALQILPGKVDKKGKRVLVNQDCFLDEQLRPRRGRQSK